MAKDKVAEPHPSGFEVLTPRGVQEGADNSTGSVAHPANSTAEAGSRDADEHVRAFCAVMASRAAFDRAYWSLDRTLSWITYRDYFHIDTPYLRGTMYPTMLGVPAVIEPAAASKLLEALRCSDNPILCFKDGKEIHGSEWESIDFPSNPKRWPQGVFARESILKMWPELPSITDIRHVESIVTSAAEIENKKQLTVLMGLSQKPTKSKAEIKAEHFANMSDRGFDRIWIAAAQETGRPEWLKAGRRPKSQRS